MKTLTLTGLFLVCIISASCSKSKPTGSFAAGDEVEYSYTASGKPDVCVPAGNSNTVLFKGHIASVDSDGYTVKWQSLRVKDFPAGTACTKNPTVWDNTSGTAYSAEWQAFYLGSPGVVPPYFPDLPAKYGDTELKVSESN